MMTLARNLVRLKSDLKDHVEGEYEFRNTRSQTRIITKEVADSSAMKSYVEKSNLHYFTFSPNSEKPIEAVICHLLPDTSAEVISNNPEDLGFKVISGRQMVPTPTPTNGKFHVEPLLLFLVTLTRNIKLQDLF
jgi:hypothetical protein